MKIETNDIIVALATAHGSAAIAIIRLSGPEVLNIVEPFIYSKTLKKISLKNKSSHSVNFALIVFQDNIIDEVLITLFKNLILILAKIVLKYHAMVRHLFSKNFYNYF